jgi:ribonuclease E
MLIDASQPEETRVAVVSGNRIEEFDFESSTKKQITGNIYLAKIVRVEPSLQAAFVEYGGNRHGFLAFSEIHPDYYQIPTADRQALLAHHAAATRKSAETYDEEPQPRTGPVVKDHDGEDHEPHDHHNHDDHAEAGHDPDADHPTPEVRDQHDLELAPVVAADPAEAPSAEPAQSIDSDDAQAQSELPLDSDNEPPAPSSLHDEDDEEQAEEADARASESNAEEGRNGGRGRRGRRRRPSETGDDDAPQEVESLGGDDSFDDMPRPRFQGGRPYKIQEVIKRRQILLIQVVKEERGTKGAALTTYLSLAGRYCVLMPNTGRGGGISRKITNAVDRKRLKAIATELDVPEGMGLIVRTAGANRTKVEIKRDFEYLLRLWENVRETTLKSTAPALILEEGSLIKRAIRDLYSKDIESVQVAGEEGYREAKEFMRMLMPSHAKNVQAYREPVPLFLRTQVETQLDQLFSPQVQLKSGGYLVIDQTEALVAIDVNSGRSTREHNIEDTALKTNLEAADEVARQLRLRDLAGLIVVDFIDMEDPRNNRAVERRMKDALKADRARIQVGRISAFGLLEMSRQRLRSSVMEISSNSCPMCNGAGVVRSVESTALHVIRGIEEEGLNGRSAQIVVRLPHAIAMFLLNQKRETLRRIEDRYGFQVIVEIDHSLIPPDFKIDRFGIRIERPGLADLRRAPMVIEEEPEDSIIDSDEGDEDEESFAGDDTAGENTAPRGERPERSGRPERAERPDSELGEDGKRRKRRRRRRRGRRDDEGVDNQANGPAGPIGEEAPRSDDEGDGDEDHASQTARPEGEQGGPGDGEGRRRRRSRRGGRRQRGEDPAAGFIAGDQPDVPPDAWVTLANGAPAEPAPASNGVESETARNDETPPPASVREIKIEAVEVPFAAPFTQAPVTQAPVTQAPVTQTPVAPPPPPPVAIVPPEEPPAGPPRKGWWRKTFSL